MPKIYKRNCDNCGKYYESSAKRFCCYNCSVKFRRNKEIIKTGLTKKKLFDLFISQKKSIGEIAKELGFTKKVIMTRLKWFNIPVKLRPKNPHTNRVHLFEKASAWKGGIKHRKNGYNAILKPEHPRANSDGYVQEHIFIWEEEHKKSLPKDWIIHHLNGIKNDNRIENLKALPQNNHYSKLLENSLKARIRELEK